MRITPIIASALISFTLFVPQTTRAQEGLARMTLDQLPAVVLVGETSAELSAQGCQRQAFSSETTSFLVDPRTPYPVIASDAVTSGGEAEMYFCSREAATTLTVQQRIAAAAGPGGGGGPANAKPSDRCGWTDPVACIEFAVRFVINIVPTVLAVLANMVLLVVSAAASYFLAYGTFLTNPFVQVGWPFVLGFANLGFVLGLLFIALATVLRIEGFAARRMLPRLLIAALLINFSLITAVFILDLSRLAMTVMAQYASRGIVCNGSAVACLPAAISQRSPVVSAGFLMGGTGDILAQLGGAGDADFVGVWMSLATIALMAIGFAVLAVIAFIRWLALIILLTLSPLAYLFIALPGAQQWARQWWQQFVKYVIYGPAIVFVLAVFAVAQVPTYEALQGVLNADAALEDWPTIRDSIAMILMSGITAGVLFAAAGLGQQLGVAGGAVAARYGMGAAKGLGKVAYVGSGTRRILRRIGEEAQQLPIVKPMRRYMHKVAASEKERKRIRDEDIHFAESEGAKRAQRFRGVIGEWDWSRGGFLTGKRKSRGEGPPEADEYYRQKYLGMYDSPATHAYKAQQADDSEWAIG
ncbi:MAG: hypothetical protein AAB538_00385, partial [Patescibacteria group bacterium]